MSTRRRSARGPRSCATSRFVLTQLRHCVAPHARSFARLHRASALQHRSRMDERSSKRDLVLAPGEYAYMQDVTKGVIKTYTGPTVINPTAQERPILFDPQAKRFDACALEQAVQRTAIAPEGYYLILKNPSVRGDHPPAGGVHPAPDLEIGRKININGPCDFALWPGQMVKLVQGHHLRSNQYLLVRVYNEDEAKRNWGQAVIKP